MMRRLLSAAAVLGGAATGYRLLVRGSLTLDVGVGRSVQPLGPVSRHIAASPEAIFDLIAEPYLGRTPRALRQKLEVWERATDMVLAAHHTPVRKAITTTLETVRFDRPARIDFRLVRGPVPHLAESFQLRPEGGGTQLTWEGELGTDFWAVGRWWGQQVAHKWEEAVQRSLAAVALEAERRSAPRATS
jgi:hypothetical protein